MIYADVTLDFRCDECMVKATSDSTKDNFTLLCKGCSEHFTDKKVIDMLEHLARDAKYALDGDNLFGFESEKEKLNFLTGARYGYDYAIFQIIDYFGGELIDVYERLRKEIRELEINVSYNAEQEEEMKKERKLNKI